MLAQQARQVHQPVHREACSIRQQTGVSQRQVAPPVTLLAELLAFPMDHGYQGTVSIGTMIIMLASLGLSMSIPVTIMVGKPILVPLEP